MNPPVTFLLTAYNQPEFIEASVESALAQTYPALTIVISDDGSTDDTLARIERRVAAYFGPHRVAVNRNERNVAIDHRRDLLPRVETEFVVLGHGDDIFMPDRVEKQVEQLIGAILPPSPATRSRSMRPGARRVSNFGPTKTVAGRGLARWPQSGPAGGDPGLAGGALSRLPGSRSPTRRIDQIVSFRALLKRDLELTPEPLVK